MPLMSISRNFFLGNEPTIGFGPFKRFDMAKAATIAREEMQQHRDRRPRHRPAGRHAVRRRAPDAGHRPRRVLRRPRPDPRRTDVGARRQGVGDRPAPRHRGPQPGPRGDLHHPQRPARAADRRLVHDPDPRPVRRHVPARRAQRRAAPRRDGRRLRARGAPGRPRDAGPARGSAARSCRPCRSADANVVPVVDEADRSEGAVATTIGDVARAGGGLDRDGQPRPGRASAGRGRRRAPGSRRPRASSATGRRAWPAR